MSVTPLVVAAFLACACCRPSANLDVDGGRAALTITTATEMAPAAPPSAPPAPLATANGDSVGRTASWRGTYQSGVGALYVPSDWKNVHWKVPDTPAGVGNGTLALSVDSTSHQVTGALDGPLGPATIDGFASDRAVTATVARQDPSDRGFSGTLLGTVANDTITGTIHLALGEAGAIRTATFTLSPATR